MEGKLWEVPLYPPDLLHITPDFTRYAARGVVMYSVVQREAIEVLAEYPYDVAVKHRMPRALEWRARETTASGALHRSAAPQYECLADVMSLPFP